MKDLTSHTKLAQFNNTVDAALGDSLICLADYAVVLHYVLEDESEWAKRHTAINHYFGQYGEGLPRSIMYDGSLVDWHNLGIGGVRQHWTDYRDEGVFDEETSERLEKEVDEIEEPDDLDDIADIGKELSTKKPATFTLADYAMILHKLDVGKVGDDWIDAYTVETWQCEDGNGHRYTLMRDGSLINWFAVGEGTGSVYGSWYEYFDDDYWADERYVCEEAITEALR